MDAAGGGAAAWQADIIESQLLCDNVVEECVPGERRGRPGKGSAAEAQGAGGASPLLRARARQPDAGASGARRVRLGKTREGCEDNVAGARVALQAGRTLEDESRQRAMSAQDLVHRVNLARQGTAMRRTKRDAGAAAGGNSLPSSLKGVRAVAARTESRSASPRRGAGGDAPGFQRTRSRSSSPKPGVPRERHTHSRASPLARLQDVRDARAAGGRTSGNTSPLPAVSPLRSLVAAGKSRSDRFFGDENSAMEDSLQAPASASGQSDTRANEHVMEPSVRRFIITELETFYSIHKPSLVQGAAEIWDQQESLKELQAALRSKYGVVLWEDAEGASNSSASESNRDDLKALSDLQDLAQGKMSAAATAISTLTQKLEQERENSHALRQSLSDLEEKHAALLAQHSSVCVQISALRDERAKAQEHGGHGACKGCAEADELAKQRLRQVEEQRKVVHVTKSILASTIARHQAQAEVADKTLKEARVARQQADKNLAVAHERVEQLESENQKYEIKISAMEQEFAAALMGKKFTETHTAISQTDVPPDGSRTRWLMLMSLKIFWLSKQELHDAGSAAQILAPHTVSRGTQCAPETTQAGCQTMVVPVETISEEQRWWTSAAGQSELRLADLKKRAEKTRGNSPAPRLGKEGSKPQQLLGERAVLELISEIYEEKVVAEYMQRKSNIEREPLQFFVLAFFLAEEGDRDGALEAMTRFIASLLKWIRIDPRTGGALVPPARHRMVLFARFLGFTVLGDTGKQLPEIGPGGLELYLAMLASARQGKCPLLESGISRMKAEPELMESVVDLFFSSQESWRYGFCSSQETWVVVCSISTAPSGFHRRRMGSINTDAKLSQSRGNEDAHTGCLASAVRG
jgi:hypothetical protein